jgi:hypothetical protein
MDNRITVEIPKTRMGRYAIETAAIFNRNLK